ncbi:uncharacterized protein K02A2.6-like [Punica granatum]|uniref:Uncharacterized protein K02A2.6-like n=1 Tax=Punica granatum TaxID=22663 RepID=A0A6P8EB77_PUNGR|nr:uncharacterized protein K02A2.6-like [Punica granatum]
MVKKSNGKWRMFVDFTYLSKACPMDAYHLSRNDLLVDSTTNNQLPSFMDAYSRYNRIMMNPADKEHTSFFTDNGALTYERLVNMMFAKQLGRNVEAYVDGMIVKSRLANGHCIDLQETFDTLQKYRMKLNPEKCAFRMQSGKFLGFMINQQGIETNLEKVPTILYMASPRNVHEVQKLTGRLTALNRFLTRSGDKCYPFFQALKRARNFAWSEECEVAFEGIKEHLHTLPALVKQMHDETLSAYLRVSDTAVSSVPIREERREQQSVYHASKCCSQQRRTTWLLRSGASCW